MAVPTTSTLASLRARLGRLASTREEADTLKLCRRFLKATEFRLRKCLSDPAYSARSIAKERSHSLDLILRYIWFEALEVLAQAELPPCALVALGGYGRGELCPYSDVDILFLHEPCSNKKQKIINNAVERVLYLLWDLGLKVGHCTRTIADCLREANSNLLTKTSFIECRLIEGDESLFTQLMDSFHKYCVQGHEEKYFSWRLREQAGTHKAYGGSVFMKEPNIKSGCGGLRDYHNLTWIAYFWKRLRTTAELVDAGVLSRKDRGELERAYDFLLRCRHALHIVCERAEDVLALPLQSRVATLLGYVQRPPIRRVEELMRQYYKAANDIYVLANSVAERIANSPISKRKGFFDFLSPKKKHPVRVMLEPGVMLIGDKITMENATKNLSDTASLLRLFQHCQEHNATFDDELLRAVRAKAYLITGHVAWSRYGREILLNILSRKGRVGRTLRLMHQTGVLGRLVPEFAPLTYLVQSEFFHLYSLDEHTLVCIEELDALLTESSPSGMIHRYRKLLLDIAHPEWLYLALLLHDTGKAQGRKNHEERSALLAAQAAKRLRLPPAGVRMLTFLVDHHLTMNTVAIRRNLEDPRTIQSFAEIVETTERLSALMLISYADARGTTRERSYSDWRDLMMWQLYDKTVQYLEGNPKTTMRSQMDLDNFKKSILQKAPPNLQMVDLDYHFANLPSRYPQTVTEEDVLFHVSAVRQFLAEQLSSEANPLRPVLQWRHFPDRRYSELIVVTWDREMLFAKVSGALSMAELDIMWASIYTRTDNLAMDIFRVRTERNEAVLDERDHRTVASILEEALRRTEYDFDTPLRKLFSRRLRFLSSTDGFPTRVIWQMDFSPGIHLVEIQTPDRPALLYDLAKTLASCKANVVHARICTDRGAAFDSFYLQLPEGLPQEQAVKTITLALTDCADGWWVRFKETKTQT